MLNIYIYIFNTCFHLFDPLTILSIRSICQWNNSESSKLMPLNIVIPQELYLLWKKGDKDEHFTPFLKK